ncbi:G5 domain-containing protein, partial [Aerococcus urinaeequi]|uniref:G5 domain-containing protein n=1 Tax=Aerococcus urinaeequi TaxID=51665 RepID=UPI003D6A61BA
MEKKYRPGHKTLLTSLTIAAILSNVSMQEVKATEESISREEVVAEAVEEVEAEAVEEVEAEAVEEVEAEAVEEVEAEAVEEVEVVEEVAEVAEEAEEEAVEEVSGEASDEVMELGATANVDAPEEETMKSEVVGREDALEEGATEQETTVTSEEIIRSEMIPFDYDYREASDVVYGELRIAQEGVTGTKEIVERITYKDGIEIKREIISTTITKKPVTEIIEVATGGIDIQSSTSYFYDDYDVIYEQGPYKIGNGSYVIRSGERGHREVDQEWIHVYGNPTNKVITTDERITKEPVDEIRYIYSQYLLFTLETTMIDVESGLKLSTPTFYGSNGTETDDYDPERLEAQIILYEDTGNYEKLMAGKFGQLFSEYLEEFNKVNGTDYIIDSLDFSIPNGTTTGTASGDRDGYYFNLSYRPGKIYVKNIGENKILPTIPESTPSGIIYSNNVEAPSYREISIKHNDEILYEDLYVDNDGEYLTTSTIDTAIRYAMSELEKLYPGEYYYDGITVNRDFLGKPIYEHGVQIDYLDGVFIYLDINVGKYSDILWEETRTEEVDFETVYVENPDLLDGEEVVSQEGTPGVRTIVEEVTYENGEETSRVIISDEVTTDPVDRVVQVGTKVVEVVEETRTEEVAFDTIRV